MGESADPETLRELLAGYFDRMRGIVERHGGTVEKFIGDAVMAVFGVPAAHEDDALRACRAAVEMRDALPELGVAARIGVNTGEVVTGAAERLVTGDAVNVAAQLEQAAAPNGAPIRRPVTAAPESRSAPMGWLVTHLDHIHARPLLCFEAPVTFVCECAVASGPSLGWWPWPVRGHCWQLCR